MKLMLRNSWKCHTSDHMPLHMMLISRNGTDLSLSQYNYDKLGKTKEDLLTLWTLATHVGDLDETPASMCQSGP